MGNEYRKSVGTLVVFIVGLSLLAGIIGILSTGGSGTITFLSLHGKTIHLYGKGIYKNDSVASAAQGIAQDWITVFLGVPLLALSCFFSQQSSLKARILLAGTLAYFLYTYMSYTFLCMYNPFFLIYVALMSMSFFSLVLVMLSFDLESLKNAFSDDLPVKTIGIVILVFAGAIGLMWLGRIVSPLLKGDFLSISGTLHNPRDTGDGFRIYSPNFYFVCRFTDEKKTDRIAAFFRYVYERCDYADRYYGDGD